MAVSPPSGLQSSQPQTPMKPVLTLVKLGAIARGCLTNGQRGKVLTVFSKAIYLLTEADELFWIATGDAPLHRRCAILPSPLPALAAGSPFRVADHRLTVDPDLLFEIGNPPLWIAPPVNQILDAASLPARIHSFFSQLDVSQAKGFGSLIPHILSLSENKSTQSEFTDPTLRFSRPLILETARACLEHQPARLPSIADNLIGLGAGLTPSGDDFLGGMTFAIHHLQTAYPDCDFTGYKLPIETYRSRAPLISFTLLKDHASGHAIEPLHRIVNGILSGESFESIFPAVLRLTRIGHSTGWDLLAGLLTGLLIAHRIAGRRHS